MGRFLRRCLHVGERLLALLGLTAVVAVAGCFTSWPWRLYHWLAAEDSVISQPPDYIVVFGGGGIPSESGLARAYYAAWAAKDYPEAKVILALPGDTEAGHGAATKMRDELVFRGVDPERILVEGKGRNTREQAINVAQTMGLNPSQDRVLVVTSPEHMRRAVWALRKVGLVNVGSRAAYGESIEVNLLYDPDELGGTRISLPGGNTLMLRYQFWNNAGYLSASLRELVALAYYWWKGWI